MASKSSKTRGSVTFSKHIKPVKPKEEWRIRLKEHNIFNSNYSCDVLLLVESNYILCPAINEIVEQGVESTTVKFLTPNNLIKFLNNTCAIKPDYDYYALYDDAFTELQEEYTNNNKLSPESFVYLIKLRILSYNEVIAHDLELVKQLMFSLEQEMRNMDEQKEKESRRENRKSKLITLKTQNTQNTLDHKYLQAKSGKLPNFVETRKIPTIYNTDYDKPDPENIYYVLSGIYDSSLLLALQKCNIIILSLIEVNMEGTKLNMEEMVVENLDEFEFDRMLSMRSFWRSLTQEKSDIPRISRSSCYIKYAIPDPETNTPSFDNFQILLKSISDFKRLYNQYFTNVRYVNVEEYSKPVCLGSMNSYTGFLDQIPNECISIPLMIHALLDEVCVRVDNWTNEQLDMLNNKKKIKRKYHGGPVVQIKSLLREYDCSHKKIPPIIKMPKPMKISYGNTLGYMNAHVPINKYVDTVEIALNELKKSLPLELFKKIDARNTFDVMFYNYVFLKWSEQLTNVSVEELTLCVYAYLFTRGNFRKFNTSKIQSECAKVNKIQECMFGVTKLYNEMHKVLNVELNKSFIKTNTSTQSNDINLLEDEVASGCDNLSQEYNTLAQELDTATFIQMINVSFKNYNHFDYKYFAPTDTILIRFHHTNDKSGYSKKKQKFFLRTPICFRDFCYKLLLQDSDWFLKEEKDYWKQVYVNLEKEKEYLLQHPKVDDNYDPADFIINGSIKYDLSKARNSAGKKSTTKNSIRGDKKLSTLEDKDDKVGKKVGRRSKESYIAAKQLDGNNDNTKVRYSIAVPVCDVYDKNKTYSFEIYNLGQHFYPLEFEEILYHSLLSVKLYKLQLPKQPLSCTFLVSSEDVNLVLHCQQDIFFQPVKPLHFNVNLTNGIVMVFSTPNPPAIHIENRHITVNKINNDEIRNSYKSDSIKTSVSKITKSSYTDEIDPKVSELKNEVLQYLTIAMKEQLPVFKIISSRLHKYQYVKRIKSKIVLPVGNIYRRVCCKPVLYKRLLKNQNIYETKCVPYSDLMNKERSPIDWKLNCSMPTGLSMETVQANVPHDFYIRQRYLIERTDLPSIEDEAYRCYLRCGIIMKFLKDGSIKTLSPDKTLSHYKYGYFSSNKNRVSKTNLIKDIRLKRQTNIIPLHAYKKNLSALEKKVRKISKKYKRHLIDIADNYRFESSRADSRKIHKIYKLSKKIYTKDSHVIPLINYSVITSEGRFIDVKNNVVHDTFKKFEETRNRDYLLNETVTRREDGTAWMIDKNGNSITQFPDGSRIKTWYTILDENLILGPDIVETQKQRVIAEEIHSESLTKFCQTGDEDDINEEEDIEILFKEPSKDQNNNSGFIFIGMNYSFEHPNFATVSYYCWEDYSAEILLPDNILVKAFEEGTYQLKLNNNDIINVDTENVELIVHNVEIMKQETCHINLALFNTNKIKPERPFLTVKENDQKVFIISCEGQITNKKKFTPDTSTVDSVNVSSDRMFVMKRDLSGMELFKEPMPYKFVHTLIDLKDVMSKKNHENVVMGPTKMKIFQSLKKTYSEHLMMMYDVPILATTKERLCLDKLWKLHDLDINTIIAKRSPLIIFERYISYLPETIIIEQLAQAVLKCIIEGNENLPNINLIQDLVQAEESVKKLEVIEEKKTSSKKFVPKHLTYKKHLERYKQLIKNDSIPRYFETVRGLMFLAVEECSEGAMEVSSGTNGPIPDGKREKTISTLKTLRASVAGKVGKQEKQEKQEKLEKLEKQEKQEKKTKSDSVFQEKLAQKSIRKIESTSTNIYQTKFNIPEHIEIHLKPNAPVHDIILTANGLQIITDKNIENYYYSLEANDLHSATNDTLIGKNSSKSNVLENAKLADPIPLSGDTNLNQNLSSLFEEDIGAAYFDKVPSWDDSICQKVCVNSFTTTTNTLVTIPDHKPNEIGNCNQETCACSVDSIQRLSKCCRCNKYYCNCKDTYSPYATCAVQNELKVSEAVCVLATKIIQTFEKDAEKFNLLQLKLENIIRDTANAWVMSESTTSDLIKTLKWIIDNKLKTKNIIPEEQAINIVNRIQATVSNIKISNRTVTLSFANLQKMADLVLNFICNSKNNANIIRDIKKLLSDAKISKLDIIDTLKLAKEKIHLHYEHGLYPEDLLIPEIPAESKCCKIIQYINYLIENTLEGTCEKCNSRSIINTSIHNTSPVNHRSKDFSKKSGTVTQETLTKKKSNEEITLKYKDDEIKERMNHENDRANIIVEPFNYSARETETQEINYAQEEFDISSQGGYSLIKSCEEIVDVSIPFIKKKSSNSTNTNFVVSDSNVQPTQTEKNVDEEQDNYILTKIQFPPFTEVPVRSKDKDIITIMAPEHNESCATHEYGSSSLLSPILLHSTQQETKINKHEKPIVYDSKIVPK